MAEPTITVDIDDLTAGSGTLTGDGVFDVLMIAGREHLKREYEAGRITGNMFAEVYIATMQSAMQQATMFTLSKDRIGYEIENLIKQNDLTAEQIALIVAQTEATIANKLLTEEQTRVLEKTQNFQPLR